MFCFENIKLKENLKKGILILFFIYTIIYIVEYIHTNKVLHFLDYSYLSIFFLFFYFLNLLNIRSIIKYIIVFFLVLWIVAIVKDFNFYYNSFYKNSTLKLKSFKSCDIINIIKNFFRRGIWKLRKYYLQNVI